MKLIQIRYFLAVAECKSITKAAEQLYLSQPALSKQMNLLEEELGVPLLRRQTSGIALTEVGEEFAKDCRIIVEDLERAVEKAVSAGKKTPGVFRIGCFDGAVMEDFLPDLYAYFRKTAPEIRVKLGRHSFSENRKALEADEIDMMIELRFPLVQKKEDDRNYCIRLLTVREGALIYSKNSLLAGKKTLTPGDFEKETFFTVKGELAMSQPGLTTLKVLGMRQPKIEGVDNFVTLISNIKLGLGYSALSKLVADMNPELLAYPLPQELGVKIVAVWKKNNQSAAKIMKHYQIPCGPSAMPADDTVRSS